MTTLRFLVRHPVKAKRIKLAGQGICEICGREEALDDLDIHSFLEEGEDQYAPADLESFLLILCTWCHWDVHAWSITVEEQEALVRERPESVREEIRTILGYPIKLYTPPEINIEDVYYEAVTPYHFGFGV